VVQEEREKNAIEGAEEVRCARVEHRDAQFACLQIIYSVYGKERVLVGRNEALRLPGVHLPRMLNVWWKKWFSGLQWITWISAR
jgi:hypothetical protein